MNRTVYVFIPFLNRCSCWGYYDLVFYFRQNFAVFNHFVYIQAVTWRKTIQNQFLYSVFCSKVSIYMFIEIICKLVMFVNRGISLHLPRYLHNLHSNLSFDKNSSLIILGNHMVNKQKEEALKRALMDFVSNNLRCWCKISNLLWGFA